MSRCGKNSGGKDMFASEMPTSKCCNSGTNNDIELKFGEFSFLIDMFMHTKSE